MTLKRIREMLFKPKGKKNWIICITDVRNYRLVEVTDHGISWSILFPLYLNLLEYLLKDQKVLVASQFIDERQGMLPRKEQVLKEFVENYGLRVAITNDYHFSISDAYREKNYSSDSPSVGTTEYIINAAGTPRIEWLEKILRWGGASLSNVMYGFRTIDEHWLETVVGLNQRFVEWYWRESNREEIFRIREEVDVMCWTSDIHLNFLIEEEKLNDFLQFIEKIAADNSLVLEVVGDAHTEN